MSTMQGKQFPPAASISLAVEYIVPGNLGCGSAVFAATIIFAPSCAARKAIALPMPRDAPDMNMVLPEKCL